MTYKMTDEERQLHESEERNVQLRKNALAAREKYLQGYCVSDEELADELDNLTQDEAAELAETIEAERKKARAEITANRCPNCGRFIDAEPDGFFDRLDREDDMGPVYAFCNESCADNYHSKEN